MPQQSTIQYYSVYFPALPAERSYDTAFLSTNKKALEKEYTTYLIEEHSDYLIDQYNKLCKSANNPTAMITDDAEPFMQRLHADGPASVFTLDQSYVKEIDYPHFHIPVVGEHGEYIELGQFIIKYGHETDAVLILNQPRLTSDDEQAINKLLKSKNYSEIDWSQHNPRKTFIIPVVWQSWGKIAVEAIDINDLKTKLQNPEFIADLTLPQNGGEYIDDSFEIDWEGAAINHESGVSYELTTKPVSTQTSPDETDDIDTVKYFSLFDLATILLLKLQIKPDATEYKCRAHWLGDSENIPELHVKLEKSDEQQQQTVYLYINGELAGSEEASVVTMHTFMKLFKNTDLTLTQTDD